MKSKYGKVKFPKRERKRLEAALMAISEIEKRGFNCRGEYITVSRSICDLLRWDDLEQDPSNHYDPLRGVTGARWWR